MIQLAFFMVEDEEGLVFLSQVFDFFSIFPYFSAFSRVLKSFWCLFFWWVHDLTLGCVDCRYYQGQIFSGTTGAQRRAPQGIAWPRAEIPVTFLPVAGRENPEGGGLVGGWCVFFFFLGGGLVIEDAPRHPLPSFEGHSVSEARRPMKDMVRASLSPKEGRTRGSAKISALAGTSWTNASEVEAVQQLLKSLLAWDDIRAEDS